MFRKVGRSLILSVLLACGFVLLGRGSSAIVSPDAEPLNDKCIRCHVDVYRQGMESSRKHRPCFEGRCIVCHLAPESGWHTRQAGEEGLTITGMPVAEQGNQWRKTTFFPSAGLQTSHEVALLGLAETKAYRFRLVLSDSPKPGAGKQQATRWLGLVPAEVPESFAATGQILRISGTDADFILSPTIERLGKAAVVVRWQTPSESFGWVELQAMEGVSLQQLTDTPTAPAEDQSAGAQGEEQHPLLVSSEFADIDLCYTCHPESSLGTSHPVRIYARGKETRIPDSLPTGKDGMLTCVTCHAPHGSESEALVRELIVTKLCVACHYTFNRTSKSTMF
jgi:predicted CXXCH cytochrome family protein